MTDTAAAAGGPLAGIRVIDLTQVVLGPMGTQILGDAGADVIKIEPPGGDMTRFIGPRRSSDMAAYFTNLNRNKRSVVLDLKQPAAHAALMRLVETADVVVHNMRLSAAARLRLDYDSLVQVNPRVIHACATGFRPGSSKAEDPAYDDIIQGMAGIAHLNGLGAQADGPRYVPSVMADKLTGTVLASSIAMALFARERTGRGQAVHVPMMDTLVSFLLPEHLWGHTLNAPELGIGYPRMLTPDRRPFATRDGHLCVMVATHAQWARLFALFGAPELAEDERFATGTARAANIEAAYAILTEGMKQKTNAEWMVLLRDADLPHGPANTLEDLIADDYLREVDFFHQVEHPSEGPMTTLGIPVSYFGTPASIRRLAPRLGEHTREVLAEAGLSADEIIAATAP
ncbi:MAG: CoA transferase [Acetobacteraceae bacterium]|nr:CoA transferase [Acetobacteraceae bacterium]